MKNIMKIISEKGASKMILLAILFTVCISDLLHFSIEEHLQIMCTYFIILCMVLYFIYQAKEYDALLVVITVISGYLLVSELLFCSFFYLLLGLFNN